MANSAAEAAIGALVLVAAAGFFVYAGRTVGMQDASDAVTLSAAFRSADGISVGSEVRLAGIRIGRVAALELDPATFQAHALLRLRDDLKLPEDSAAKISSEGLLGGAYVEVLPGASDFVLAEGDEFTNTQNSESLLNLLMRFGARTQ
jgi:phospholipid/cholesterol/gamma-HCH transport system substrate-binding protein